MDEQHNNSEYSGNMCSQQADTHAEASLSLKIKWALKYLNHIGKNVRFEISAESCFGESIIGDRRF